MTENLIISEIRQLPTLNNVNLLDQKTDKVEVFNILNSINRTFANSIGVDMATTLCDLISKGNKIRDIAEQIGVPTISLIKWLKETNPDGFDEAQEVRASDLVEEAIEDADNIDQDNAFINRTKATIKLKAAELKKPKRQEIAITTPATAGVVFVQATNAREVIDVTPVDD